MKNVLAVGFIGALLAVGMTAAPEAQAFPRACNATNVGSYSYEFVSTNTRNVYVCTAFETGTFAWRFYELQYKINGVWVSATDIM